MFTDSKKPTETQRQNLLIMIHNAFVEIRILGWQGKSEQASDLADAFHNLPVYLESDDFSFSITRNFIESYHLQYKETVYNYLEMLDNIIKEENLEVNKYRDYGSWKK